METISIVFNRNNLHESYLKILKILLVFISQGDTDHDLNWFFFAKLNQISYLIVSRSLVMMEVITLLDLTQVQIQVQMLIR